MRPTRRLPVVFAVLAVLIWAPACGDNKIPAEVVPNPACSDGIDNDGDGLTDYPDDLGCDNGIDDSEDSAAKPKCSDGRDNDGDGLVDFPNDPGCLLPQSDDETDDCPDGPNCPQCANGKDDDGNGSMDYPADPGCMSAADTIEFTDNPVACGANLTIKHLPANGMDTGMLDTTSQSQLPTTCGGGGGAAAVAYVVTLTRPKILVATTDGSPTDTVIDIRGTDCTNATASLGCSDDISIENRGSTLTVSLPIGTYYIIVEGHDSSVLGPYTLTVTLFSGEGEACTTQAECGPGLVCRVPTGGTNMICTKPECSDGVENDTDGKIDFPDDPGCEGPDDNSESDDCPSGPNCPACSNGLDDDNDGQTDYPVDTSCTSASSNTESCNTEQDPIGTVSSGTTLGTLVGAHDDHEPSCSFGSGGLDKLFVLSVPQMATLDIDTNNSGLDTVLSVLPSTCSEPSLDCNDDGGSPDLESALSFTNLAAGTYVIAVDGFSDAEVGPFNLHVSGTIAAGGSCEGQLFASGAFTCPTGITCQGTPGSRTCRTQCSDGIDNNADGKIDFPNDPGCTSLADDSEDTVCPGVTCPVCSDGIDNDTDGHIDFPADPSCRSASGTSESCAQTEPIIVVTTQITNGDTTGLTSDFEPSCSFETGAPDVALQLDLPAMTSLTLDPGASFFNIAVFTDSTCGPAELTCTDAAITTGPLAAGRYFLIIDGDFTDDFGAFALSTTGTIAAGGSCESPLAVVGAITCGSGFTCDGTPGSRSCVASQCNDGIDNNADGKIDYPNDPGCASPSDNTETTVCPGAGCPVCANGADDDTDGLFDFPADFGCSAAGGTSEAFCTAEQDFAGTITQPVTNGTLAAPAHADYAASCQSTTGNDVSYSLRLPVGVQTLVLDTLATTTDTILSLKDANCGLELGCNDDVIPFEDFRSQLTVTNVLAGNYAINVDSFSTSNNAPFTLTVKGTVAVNTVCTSPLFAAGVLVCPIGTTCNGGTCH